MSLSLLANYGSTSSSSEESDSEEELGENQNASAIKTPAESKISEDNSQTHKNKAPGAKTAMQGQSIAKPQAPIKLPSALDMFSSVTSGILSASASTTREPTATAPSSQQSKLPSSTRDRRIGTERTKTGQFVPPQLQLSRSNISTEDVSSWNSESTNKRRKIAGEKSNQRPSAKSGDTQAKSQSFKEKEKLKRDRGQASRGKSFVEEEKRLLREQGC